jgi:adenylate cyclase class 2
LSTETEIKVRLVDKDAFIRLLEGLQPVVWSPRQFEDNFLLDFADQRFKLQGCLVRVRVDGGGARFTFKGPARPEGIFKVREELETTIGDASVMIQALERMGLCVWFRYQKYRTHYLVVAPHTDAEKIHVLLDETPVGLFAEFEGSEEGIRSLAASMGFDEKRYLRDSYYSIYSAFCRERGEIPGNMTFPCAELGQDPIA